MVGKRSRVGEKSSPHVQCSRYDALASTIRGALPRRCSGATTRRLTMADAPENPTTRLTLWAKAHVLKIEEERKAKL